jgi:hypothetical protein
MSLQDLKDQIASEFRGRKFAPALALAILDFLQRIKAPGNYSTLEKLLVDFPRKEKTRAGKTANTLIVEFEGSTLSLRRFYNHYENLFRVEHKRFDFPNMAPHATQAWGDYRRWFDWMLALSDAEQVELRSWAIKFVLSELPSHEVDASTIRPLARPFSRLLRDFPLTAGKGEKPGAAFQGIVFAYIRADAPHLFLEVAKVGAGSKRLQRVGDIDGWQGERLVITVECKSYDVDLKEAFAMDAFLGEAQKRKALATVAALAFDEDAGSHLATRGAKLLHLGRLRDLVDLWDPLKQQAAYEGFAYYAHHVEQNDALMKRLAHFAARLESDNPEAGG